MKLENSFVVPLIIIFAALVIPLGWRSNWELDSAFEFDCVYKPPLMFNHFTSKSVSVKVIGAPSADVLCFYGFCQDAMPFPIRAILDKLNKTDRPLSDDHVSTRDVRALECKINSDPYCVTDLQNEDDNLLTAILIAFLDGLRGSVLLPTTATEFIISANNSKVLINRIALLPRPNRVILVGILELGHTLRQRGIMQASDVAQLFGPHLYRPLERIKLSDSDYQQTLTILNPGLIHLIENYDAEKMAKLSEDFEASSEYLDRDYLYEVVYDGTCRA